MQLTVLLGLCERIIGQGEMVHAHIDIPRHAELLQCEGEQVDFFVAAGQGMRVDAALRLEAFGQMGIGVQGDAVRPQRADLLQGVGKGGRCLVRKAVDEIGVDRSETDLARRRDQGEDLFGGLNAVYGLLHGGIEVLHAKTDAVEPQLRQVLQAPGIDGARVHFDGIFALGVKKKMLPQQLHELRQFLVGQKGGRAAAQMQLGDGLAGEMRAVKGQLLPQQMQILGSLLPVPGDDLVAGAEIAQGGAKRQVHINRQCLRRSAAPLRLLPFLQSLDEGILAKHRGEAVGRGVGGIARTRNVVADQQFGGDGGDFCAHVRKDCRTGMVHAVSSLGITPEN